MTTLLADVRRPSSEEVVGHRFTIIATPAGPTGTCCCSWKSPVLDDVDEVGQWWNAHVLVSIERDAAACDACQDRPATIRDGATDLCGRCARRLT